MKTILKAILIPFVVTRLYLLLIGYVSPQLLPISSELNPSVPLTDGKWLFSSHRSIDMWARWDSGWYLDIAKDGYRMGKDVYSMSNLAFYPTYPYFVKGVSLVVPTNYLSNEVLISIGIVVSNLFLIGSLVILYHLTNSVFGNKTIAQHAIWLVLLFPTSFFLSSFYTESMFLFLTLLSCWWAHKNHWLSACLVAAVATATRPVGIFIVVPLMVTYLQNKDWRPAKLDHNSWWFFLIPSGIVLFFTYLYLLTGDFLAAVKVQSAWGKQLTDPFQSLLSPTGYWPHITAFDQGVVVASLITSFLMIKHRLKKLLVPFGLYTLLLTIPLLFTGTVDSASRFALVAFPLYQYWAFSLHTHPKARLFVFLCFACIQAYYFALFTQFYWVG